MILESSKQSVTSTSSIISNIININSMKEIKHPKKSLDEELSAPIATSDLDDLLEFIASDENNNEEGVGDDENNNELSSDKTPGKHKENKNTLFDSIDLCNSLEDLVKTFDHNVKECLTNYKDIDVGQLAPVQVRSQEDIINDSQIWYTLTGNFGNLLPIDYWNNSLVRKYHNESLNLDIKKKKNNQQSNEDDDLSSYNEFDMSEKNSSKHDEFDSIYYTDEEEDDEDDNESDDDEELKEQLDMHSTIITRNNFSDSYELDEPLVTAEQVLDELDSMMAFENDMYEEELTPDSGFFSTVGLNGLNISELDSSYIKYINTFVAENEKQHQKQNELTYEALTFVTSNKSELNKLNLYELNEIVDQVENNIKDLSENLIEELALRDELELEKETRNTFITLLLNIQEKQRHLTLNDSLNKITKKKNRKSASNFDIDSIKSTTHLTTVIPYNDQVDYNINHLQILNKLLKAIDEDSHQVPELLTNYILKVLCPT